MIFVDILYHREDVFMLYPDKVLPQEIRCPQEGGQFLLELGAGEKPPDILLVSHLSDILDKAVKTLQRHEGIRCPVYEIGELLRKKNRELYPV